MNSVKCICFKCPRTFNNPNELFYHFKHDHFLSATELVECRQLRCRQSFSNFKSFRAHIKYVHKMQNIQNNSSVIELGTQDVLEQNVSNVINGDDMEMTMEPSEHNLMIMNQTDATHALNSNENVFDNIKIEIIKFSLQLYAKSYMPRNEIVSIQNSITNIFFSILIMLQKLKNSLVGNDHIMNDLNTLIKFCKDPFFEIKSEYLMFKLLKEKNLLDFPKVYNINCIIGERIDGGIPNFGQNFTNTYLMPIRFQIKKFLELPGVYETIKQNTENMINSPEVSNFVCGEIYKAKLVSLNKENIIPLFLYFDDIQINDPLGSHKSSICACYYFFPTMPQHLLSKLKYIFKLAYIASKDRKNIGNEHMLHQLVNEFKLLEEQGIEINTPEGSFQVHLLVGLILGDNLELNTILGFVRSFSANKFCRVCKIEKLESQECYREIENLLRTRENVDADLLLMDSTSTGLREECVFNSIQSFHVTQNFCFDIMHDLFEGVCEYDVCNILKALLADPSNDLTLEILNARKRLFPYGPLEINNNSRDLSQKRIEQSNLEMTASEIWSFVHFLPLMIGDLIPHTNEHWKLLCLMLKVVDGCLLSKYSPENLTKLENDIAEHHELYVRLYGKTLKPKHHFMCHYPTAIKRCGPLKYLWCMRLEAEHKNIKNYCKNITSRNNIALSCCKKACLQFSHFINSFEADMDYNEEDFELENLSECVEFYENILNPTNLNLEQVKFSKKLIYRGSTYKKNYYLSSNLYSNDELNIHKIEGFILIDHVVFVLVRKANIVNFNNHLLSYEINGLESPIQLMNINEFTSPPMHQYTINDGKSYIRNKII